MKPERDVEKVEEEHVDTQRQGSAAGLVAGLLILVLLAGSGMLVTYFWRVFEIAVPQPNVSTPAPRSDGREWAP